jgi:hypothetical protein
VLEFHPDNGLEFLNHFLLTYWKQAVPHLALSRSRPFHKNDNPFVEEKNGSLVRGYIGFARLDTVAQTNLLNQIYDRMWLLHNFFHPVMRRQDHGGPTDCRGFDRPTPAFDRLCACNGLPAVQREALANLRQTTNPLELRDQIHDLLDRLDRLPRAKPLSTQDVHRTLFQPSQPIPVSLRSVTLSIEGSISPR